MKSVANDKSAAELYSEVYAIIDGTPIALPGNAKYICQDKRGCWYFCSRRPRVKNGDWTPNKTPIQLVNGSGRLTARVLITDKRSPWPETLQTTIKRDQLPIQAEAV